MAGTEQERVKRIREKVLGIGGERYPFDPVRKMVDAGDYRDPDQLSLVTTDEDMGHAANGERIT
ncbi:MAG: hypothetical protein AMJ75_02555 [Phycisphaerae bacterium SM1_79]|nr:MAG: hypothetical protein AMJ75_02555 [Phycisphaerae bacterium SM1_79]